MTSESVRATPPCGQNYGAEYKSPEHARGESAQERLARIFRTLRGERHQEAHSGGREAGDPDQTSDTKVFETDGVDGHLQS